MSFNEFRFSYIDVEIITLCMIFFQAVFEPTVTTLSFFLTICYEF